MDVEDSSCEINSLSSLPCRETQVKLLLELFGERCHFTCPAIFIYGHSASGKTLVVKSLLDRLQLPHAFVNCVECYSDEVLFERVLNQVSRTKPGPTNGYSSFDTCKSMNDFVRCLRRAIEERYATAETVYLVFDKAERLCDGDYNLLPGLLRLQELMKMNVCVILISELVWEKFRSGTGFLEPFQIHFPNYTKDELVKILNRDCPDDCEAAFYANYVNLFLSVFSQVCRNLAELRHLALLNFGKYREPVCSGEAKSSDVRKLWRNIEPHLKKALQTVYLREMSSSEWERMDDRKSDDATGGTNSGSSSSFKMTTELPFYSKYLLIAAYLASYNPAKVDRRFFAKNHEKVRKTLRAARSVEKTNNHLTGPKAFPLDRLLAVFYSIVEERVVPTAFIYSQVSTLVSLHLLYRQDTADPLQAPKYKCLVTLEFIRNIAKSVNFDVIRYLYDFI